MESVLAVGVIVASALAFARWVLGQTDAEPIEDEDDARY